MASLLLSENRKKVDRFRNENLPGPYFARADSRPRIMNLRLLEPVASLLQRMQETHKEFVTVKSLNVVPFYIVEGGNTVLLIQPHDMI